MNLQLLLAVHLAHFVGDWRLQTNWQATNKAKNWWALSSHVLVVAAVLLLAVVVASDAPLVVQLQWVTVNAVLHFVTDAITSRLTSRYWFVEVFTPREVKGYLSEGEFVATINGEKRQAFFHTIGLDQMIHFWTYLLTIHLLGV